MLLETEGEMLLKTEDKILLKAENVSKRFQLGQYISLASSLRSLKHVTRNPITFWRGPPEMGTHERMETRNGSKYLWAVRNVNLEVRRGERVAILGRNGAGKSTLLKLLVGIMQPTTGRIWSNARIVPLLGIGAGFDPELTGRENTRLNAAILGFHPAELRERMEAIVDFAEIPEFMDTPMKRYSKGMRARLALAVAFHLSPEILIVDEVLAVGDLHFRAKCIERIQNMCKRGMALLFVTHSPKRVASLCERAVLMRDGVVVEDGKADLVAHQYIKDIGEAESQKGEMVE